MKHSFQIGKYAIHFELSIKKRHTEIMEWIRAEHAKHPDSLVKTVKAYREQQPDASLAGAVAIVKTAVGLSYEVGEEALSYELRRLGL